MSEGKAPEPLNTQWAEVALQLLDRTEIKGAEVSIFSQVSAVLQGIKKGELLVVRGGSSPQHPVPPIPPAPRPPNGENSPN